jgi:hypothetical protein
MCATIWITENRTTIHATCSALSAGDKVCGLTVKLDVLVERDDSTQRGFPEHRDEVATDGKEDENNVDVENLCRASRDDCHQDMTVYYGLTESVCEHSSGSDKLSFKA